MDIRQLRYFVGIADARSFSRAAERLHVAQSALSQHIRKLEEELGVQLLVREARGVALTAAGEKLLAHARAILVQLGDAERDVRRAGDVPSGPVSVGVPAGVARLLNPPLLQACAEELPHVSLRIVEVLPGHVLEWLDSGHIQLGVHYVLGAPTDGALLAEEDYYLVSGAPQPSLEDAVRFTDLPRFPLVLPTCAYNPQHCIAVHAEARGVKFDIETRVDSLATILDLVRNGPGHSILTPGAMLAEWYAGCLFAYRIEPAVTRAVMLSVGFAAAAERSVRAVEAIALRVARRLVAEGDWPRQLPCVQRPVREPERQIAGRVIGA